jgi:hypothetical protein
MGSDRLYSSKDNSLTKFIILSVLLSSGTLVTKTEKNSKAGGKRALNNKANGSISAPNNLLAGTSKRTTKIPLVIKI